MRERSIGGEGRAELGHGDIVDGVGRDLIMVDHRCGIDGDAESGVSAVAGAVGGAEGDVLIAVEVR